MSAPKLLYTIEQPHGLGELYFVWQKGEGRSLLATTGTDATVAIHDRTGKLQERIKLQGLCAGLEWDNDGDILAIITPNSNSVLLWECHTNKRMSIETGLREPPSCIAWAYGEPLLAVGTQKGNLALYNHHTTKRIPIIGKHTKKITCAAWNKDSILVLASEDKTLSINNVDGDTLRIITLRDLPNDLQFSEMKTDERVAGENTISLVVGKRTLYLYNLLNPENPIELAFQQRYGSIVSYKWYGDGYILIGFSAGYIIAISTHIKEVGEELFQVKNHKDNLSDVAVCDGLAATCGDGQLKLISLWNNGEVSGSVAPPGGAERCGFSSDGRLLATAGRAYLSAYVTSLPPLYGVYGTRAVALTSLNEATVYQCIAVPEDAQDLVQAEPTALATYTLPTEPTHLALGSTHLCCVVGAHAWFYRLGGGGAARRQYPGAVTSVVAAAEYVAAMFDGRALLHEIEQSDTSQPERATLFPEPHMQGANIVAIHLTADFFIFATDHGHIEYFSIDEWRYSTRYKHSSNITSLYCDIGGTRAFITDDKHRAFIYSPAYDEICPVEEVPPHFKGVIWDICLSERNVLAIYTETAIHTYHYSPHGVHGPRVRAVCATPLPAAHAPLLQSAATVYCRSDAGITKIALESHNTAGLADADTEKRIANQKKHIEKLILLCRFHEARLFCDALEDEEMWRKLGEAAILQLQHEFAISVYTKLNDVAMVWALEDAANIEDMPTLCAMLSACLGLGDTASRWAASRPAAALEIALARGLWHEAAALAAAAAPHRANRLQYNHAAQLELTGDYHEALAKYEKSLMTENTEDPQVKQHNDNCEAGIARMSIRCGDAMRGITLAMKHSTNKTLLKDCAELLEEEKQYSHAATLYDHAGNTDKAASLYIKLKSWLKVEALLPKINSPSVHLQYAKAKEAEGRYADAMKSYLKAQDYEAAIRLNLEKLDDIDEAVTLVQETKSVQGAKMVANYFQNSDDPTSAIKFLVMSLCYDEAFQLARKIGKLHLFGEILIQMSQARSEDFRSLALHFEGEKNHLLAGKFFFHAGEYSKAMGHLLKAGGSEEDDNEAISVAIDAAAASDDDRLTRRLIEYLLGEADGAPREPRHLFRLYMAKKQYAEAAKTAVIIARAECGAGRYREARDVLRAMSVSMRPAPRDVMTSLAALHSYILVRSHVRRGRHDLAAELLARLAADIHFFPTQQHQVSILTSTVIECTRAGLQHEAHHWARVLMQPQYRAQIDPKYSKKIEYVVRHGAGGGGGGRGRDAPCPQCGAPAHVAALTCPHCQQTLPFCVATGLHVVKEDLTACPECDFPAIMSEFIELLKDEGKCPMCGENVDHRRLVKIDDPTPYLDVNTTE